MPIPNEVIFQGDSYTYDGWADANVDLMDCSRAATGLGLNMTGQQAVKCLVEYVEQHGPGRGSDIARGAFGVEGHLGIKWSSLFQYACRRHGLLHYKIDPNNRNSPALFAFEHQVTANADPGDVHGERPD